MIAWHSGSAVRHRTPTPGAGRRVSPIWFQCIVFAALGGCGLNERLPAPVFSPAAAAAQAIALYDKNGDGVLDEKELEKCPALKSALEKMDTNNDKRLSAEEIAARLTLHQQAGIGITTVACKVWANHGPLEAATVRLIPEPFMGSAFQPAAGVSDANGAVDLRIDGSKYPGVHCGFYRVEVSKTDGAGRESLPARYNAQTTLGAEVAPDMRGGLVFKLTTENKR